MREREGAEGREDGGWVVGDVVQSYQLYLLLLHGGGGDEGVLVQLWHGEHDQVMQALVRLQFVHVHGRFHIP